MVGLGDDGRRGHGRGDVVLVALANRRRFKGVFTGLPIGVLRPISSPSLIAYYENFNVNFRPSFAINLPGLFAGPVPRVLKFEGKNGLFQVSLAL